MGNAQSTSAQRHIEIQSIQAFGMIILTLHCRFPVTAQEKTTDYHWLAGCNNVVWSENDTQVTFVVVAQLADRLIAFLNQNKSTIDGCERVLVQILRTADEQNRALARSNERILAEYEATRSQQAQMLPIAAIPVAVMPNIFKYQLHLENQHTYIITNNTGTFDNKAAAKQFPPGVAQAYTAENGQKSLRVNVASIENFIRLQTFVANRKVHFENADLITDGLAFELQSRQQPSCAATMRLMAFGWPLLPPPYSEASAPDANKVPSAPHFTA